MHSQIPAPSPLFPPAGRHVISTIDRIVTFKARLARSIATRVVNEPQAVPHPLRPIRVSETDEVTW